MNFIADQAHAQNQLSATNTKHPNSSAMLADVSVLGKMLNACGLINGVY
ncbi:hypothetical protein [Weissella kandleri]|nr:hypothetical protein [Weissella kandleri]